MTLLPEVARILFELAERILSLPERRRRSLVDEEAERALRRELARRRVRDKT